MKIDKDSKKLIKKMFTEKWKAFKQFDKILKLFKNDDYIKINIEKK